MDAYHLEYPATDSNPIVFLHVRFSNRYTLMMWRANRQLGLIGHRLRNAEGKTISQGEVFHTNETKIEWILRGFLMSQDQALLLALTYEHVTCAQMAREVREHQEMVRRSEARQSFDDGY